ncbi:hypothetical protein A2U01_0003544 [Trifolium medium]|uniref:Uncharacterized protein n=1 Tax=Trifolium medium TaxID=97028 RepID=A0A392M6J6_9FABA|nr:hypothetical protein [Trifolium medium]
MDTHPLGDDRWGLGMLYGRDGTCLRVMTKVVEIVVKVVKARQYPQSYWRRLARRCGEFLDEHPRVKLRWVR